MLTLDITAAGVFVGSNTGNDWSWSSVTCTCGKCLNDTQNSNLISYRFRSQQFRHFHTLIILSTQSSQNKIICTDYNKGDKSIYIFMTNELWQNWWDPNHGSILRPVLWLLWMLGAGHCCGGCGHRSVTPGEAAQEAAPGSGELLWPPAHCSSGRCTQGIERQVCKHQISYYILGGFQSNKSSCQFLMDLYYKYYLDLGF